MRRGRPGRRRLSSSLSFFSINPMMNANRYRPQPDDGRTDGGGTGRTGPGRAGRCSLGRELALRRSADRSLHTQTTLRGAVECDTEKRKK